MLALPPLLHIVTQRETFAKATDADVALIRGTPSLGVRDSYLEFITRFGYVTFDPLDDPCEFDYEYREPKFAMRFSDSIKAFMHADKMNAYFAGLVVKDDDDLPRFPPFMLPICSNPGQSHILLECGGDIDRVWFWEFQGDAWGEGNNVRLGFVAQTFQDLLYNLRVPSN